VPDNITLMQLPPYCPELNPVENVWQYLRQNELSFNVRDGVDAIVDACCAAWNKLVSAPETITSIATRKWANVFRALDDWYYAAGGASSRPHSARWMRPGLLRCKCASSA